jgi:crotonobetainyl-CoA:carnitine CoA-transferase CaiB-like acyl-CoA transferase
MNEVLAQRTRAEWVAAFDSAGVPVWPVHDIGEALSHPQTVARGMVVDCGSMTTAISRFDRFVAEGVVETVR